MTNLYYLSAACDVDMYGQSDELYLMDLNGMIIGYSSGYDVYTFDVRMARSEKDCSEVIWHDPVAGERFVPATLALIKEKSLLDVVIGCRSRVDANEPIIPFGDLPCQ